MENHPIIRKKIYLAVVPAIFAMSIELGLWRYLAIDHIAFPWGFALVCGAVCAIGFAYERRIAVWSYPAFGILLAYLMFSAVSLFDRFETDWILAIVIMVSYFIVPILVGLYLARKTGILAGLIIVGVAYVFWEGIGDPEYALGMHTNNTTLVGFISICPQLCFLALAPVIVLYVSSTEARLIGYLLPLSVGLVVANGLGAWLRPYSSFIWITSWDFIFILLPLFIALMLFTRVNQKTVALGQNTSP